MPGCFGVREYKSYILVDFNKASKKVRDNFETNLNNLDVFFQVLSLEYNKPLFKRGTLIIFDEIQKFPKAAGMSYQTLINSIILCYVTGGFVFMVAV